MTVFFNKKEEVIDLQLTPYGEALLSIGQLEPAYYAFFDEDILYDASGSAGLLELQNDVEPRIQENTPAIKVQTVFSGIESNLRPLIRDLRYEAVLDFTGDGVPDLLLDISSDRDYADFPPNIDQNFSLIEPLGTMELGSDFAPAWSIKVLKGELTGAINYMTGSRSAGTDSDVRRIPQLDFDIDYRVVVGDTSIQELNAITNGRIMSQVYGDGTFLYLDKDPGGIILAVDEENAPVDLDYDIEVFSIADDISSVETPTLTPMNFPVRPSEIVDGVLLDKPVGPGDVIIDSTFAEYFFLLNIDKEIPAEEICPLVGDLQTRGVTLANLPYDCKDVESIGRFDIYGTNAVEGPPCDD